MIIQLFTTILMYAPHVKRNRDEGSRYRAQGKRFNEGSRLSAPGIRLKEFSK
jgi:hypothetical protein